MAKKASVGGNKIVAIPKQTSIGGGRVKTSSMNKHKKRSYKKYRGQGK